MCYDKLTSEMAEWTWNEHWLNPQQYEWLFAGLWAV